MKRIVVVIVVTSASLVAWLVACAQGEANPLEADVGTPETETDGGTPDGGTPDGGTPETGCTTLCNNVCTDLKTDIMNCGACGNTCGGQADGGGGWGCANGTCSCPQSKTDCNGECVDMQNDMDNCGGCNNRCSAIAGQKCTAGVCCTPDKKVCGNVCIDVLSDSNHCGACDAPACGMGQYCGNGTCFNNGEYTQQFTQGQAEQAKCNAWQAFRSHLDGNVQYTKITLKGSFDDAGVTCTGEKANTLCQALKNGVEVGSDVPFNCGGPKWGIRKDCSPFDDAGPPEVAIGAFINAGQGDDACGGCNDPAYSVRPCSTNLRNHTLTANWGGINSPTCPTPPTQEISVICEP
jgi:hypothetical protein